MRLSDVDSSRDNNMDLMRFLAASAVIYGHAFHLQNLRDPLEELVGRSTGSLAVAVFFALSGFLIAKSLTNRPSLLEFLVARALRILPALIVVNVLVVLIAGFTWSSMSAAEFFGGSQPWTYIFWNSSLLKCQFELPGVFSANAYGDAVNGSLWTLPVEARMYGLVFLAGATSLVIGKVTRAGNELRRYMVGGFGVVGLASSLFLWEMLGLPHLGGVLSEPGVRLMGFFSAGMVAHAFRKKIYLDGRLIVVGFLVLYCWRETRFAEAFLVPWLAYTCLWTAYSPRINARGFGSKGDFSYGIYIFAFPVQQWFYSQDPGMAPLTNAGFTFPIVVVLAAISFWCIERPSLRFKHTLSEKVRFLFGRKALQSTP